MRSYSRLLLLLTIAGVVGLVGCAEADEAASRDDPPQPETHQIEVYFTNLELGDIGEVHPVTRETTEEDLPRAALTELLAGPTADEQQEGYSSWFSADTASVLISLQVDDGVAVADFDADLPEIIPGASSSAGAAALLAELDATLVQFDGIDQARYRLDGDAAAFYEWLQLAPPDREPAVEETEPAETEPAETEPAEDEPSGDTVVQVYFVNIDRGADTEVFAVERTVGGTRPLQGALEALLAGPTDTEEAEGYSSWFSDETAAMLDAVRIEDGIAQVDFDPELAEAIPGASSSAGSTALLAALDATVTQFSTVDDAVYSLGGDVDAFYQWLQREGPRA